MQEATEIREDTPVTMRRFILERYEDHSGVSGTGVVAEGVELSCGRVVMAWRTDWYSIVVHEKGIEAVEAVHGHGGRTKVVWLD